MRIRVSITCYLKNDPSIMNKLSHPKTFQSLTVKTERYRKTYILYCLRHYHQSCITAARIINSFFLYNEFRLYIFTYILFVLIQLSLPNKKTVITYGRIAEIFASQRKLGSSNTMVTSDFRPEMEIRPFRASVMHPDIIIGAGRSLWTWLWGISSYY